MAMPNANTIAQNWANGMGAAGEKIRSGINAVTEAPTAKAARRVDAMIAGMQRAAAEGKIQRGLERVTLEDWKRAALDKGVARIAGGAQAAKPKVQEFFTEFIPHLQQGLQALEAMPRGDVEQNIARATAMMRHNAKFRKSR